MADRSKIDAFTIDVMELMELHVIEGVALVVFTDAETQMIGMVTDDGAEHLVEHVRKALYPILTAMIGGRREQQLDA